MRSMKRIVGNSAVHKHAVIWACGRCECSVWEEDFILQKHLWDQVAFSEHHGGKRPKFLCVGCVEQVLKRKLVAEDFNRDIPINWVGKKSLRLLKRMNDFQK